MTYKDPAVVFELANILALGGWLWLLVWLFLPSVARWKIRYSGVVLPLILAIVYAAAMLVNLSSAQGSFDSLEGVVSLFNDPGATLGGWVHYLAFDLFVGWCLAQHAVLRSVNRLLVVVCLFFTFLLGPVGLLLYTALFISRTLVERFTDPTLIAPALWARIFSGQTTLAQCGVFLCFLLPVFAAALAMDTRTVLEVNVWVKPLKFAVALILYTLTLSWYASYLSTSWRQSRWFNGFSGLAVAAIVLEMIWLIYAASIGEPSHFNLTHPVLAPVYPMMGVLAVLLTAQALITGLGLLRNPTDQLHGVTRYALAFGLIATFFLTVGTAGYLSSAPAQSHTVLAEGAGAAPRDNTILFMGWLRSAGDLRVAHFFATHAMHAIPLIGWIVALTGLAGTRPTTHRWLALGITAFYSVLVLLVFAQALNGKPFL